MDVKKLIEKKLNHNTKFWTKRLNNLLGKSESKEEDIYNAVWNIHHSMIALKLLHKGDYDYIERNEKLYYKLPNGREICLNKKSITS